MRALLKLTAEPLFQTSSSRSLGLSATIVESMSRMLSGSRIPKALGQLPIPAIGFCSAIASRRAATGDCAEAGTPARLLAPASGLAAVPASGGRWTAAADWELV